ncbi:MAG TPA: LLM class flavin-dependent oxidoreductase [Dehalococcoidia bacterium]|nr:LLM class flavin-dependent oxidoreductase [Dehalococcoidia bacterium]
MAEIAQARGTIGVSIQAPNAAAAVEQIVAAEDAGVPAAWLTTGGTQADALTVFAAAGTRTDRILMGSSIIPTWPRNPVFIAQQVVAIESLAPGRFRLGIGPSTKGAMRGFGVDFRTPLTQLREYLTILGSLLHEGSVDFSGSVVSARARIGSPVPTPVMASALQPGAFELCGELSDGAITWVCPPAYLVETALPAIQRGATAADRPTPPIVMHVPVSVSDDPQAVREAAQRQIGGYPSYQFYREMFVAAGYEDAADGLSPELVDELVAHGSEQQVADRLLELLDLGMGEILAMPLITDDDAQGSTQRAFAAVALAASRS